METSEVRQNNNMAGRNDRRNSSYDSRLHPDDTPPNSRLFIVCSKQLTEEDFRDAFSKFGEIEEIWVVKDRNTGDRKGVTYIKYAKTSEAAAALEEMNGQIIGNCTGHIKVMIAASRDQGSKREGNEEERMQRLFVIVPKNMTDEELYEYFKQFGDIDYASVIRDRETRESKGFAYVKYFRFSHAAAAFENCEKKYRAVFAEPRRTKSAYDQYDKYNNSFDPVYPKQQDFLPGPPAPLMMDNAGGEGYTRLQVIASPYLNQDQLWKLFDIVPGMDYCQARTEGRRATRNVAIVAYSSPQWASYAREKLHGFEYPPGHRLIVKPDMESVLSPRSMDSMTPIGRGPAQKRVANNPIQSNLAHLAETIAQATSLIQAAGLAPDVLPTRQPSAATTDSDYCNVTLPPPQPLADIDAPVAARCFIVCTPQPPPINALRDVFSRFGNLIDVYTLTNRNCGYAKYAKKTAAEDAIKTLHGAMVCGIRMKVLEAEEPKNGDDRRKRVKRD